ncbi:unnamed protein product [Paramecium sonneborni]|uniref:Protein kinase domain-containing protein n=1 Tax=Paramecium sonneborni TaxID=65129 RepID=A0A8S1KYG1_9CILI|nr:unnamed protein product [Paramecium sonneborni]
MFLNNYIKINDKQYTILEKIGEGSSGKVYKGQYLNQFYAIKQQEYLGEGEYEFYQHLNQPKESQKFRNLIQIYDVVKIDRFIYIVMELGESSLYDETVNNKIDKTNIRFIMQQIGSGIKQLHEDLNLAHRDLKPENILVQTIKSEITQETQQIFKLCDFGYVKNINNLKTKAIGTPYYIAPELLNNSNDLYNKKCDIWSFGQLIYELISGSLMFQGDTIQKIQNQILTITDGDIQNLIDKLLLEREYKELLKNMLKRNVKDRYDINQVLNCLKPKSRSQSRNTSVESKNYQNPAQISIRTTFQFQGQIIQKQQCPLMENKFNQNQCQFIQKTNNEQKRFPINNNFVPNDQKKLDF